MIKNLVKITELRIGRGGSQNEIVWLFLSIDMFLRWSASLSGCGRLGGTGRLGWSTSRRLDDEESEINLNVLPTFGDFKFFLGDTVRLV